MRKNILLLALTGLFTATSFAQMTVVIKYPKCEVKSQSVFNDIKGNKTFTITTQAEFDKYFKLTDENEKINFSKKMVLAGLIGVDEPKDYIEINAAAYNAKGKTLYVRYDIKDEKMEDNAKFCVAVVTKADDFKKVNFLKGKAYNRQQMRGD